MTGTGEWLSEYDRAADGHMATLFGVARPTGTRTLKTRMTRYLRDPDPDPWSHRLMADGMARMIDAGLDAVLRSHGVRPDAMLLLSLMGAVPEIRHGVLGRDTSLMPKENDGARVRGIGWLARNVAWDSLGDSPFIHLRRHEMPESVAAAAAGRPLRDFVSHPVLNGLDLVVDHVDKAQWGPRIHLRDVPLLEMEPSGRRGEGDARC